MFSAGMHSALHGLLLWSHSHWEHGSRPLISRRRSSQRRGSCGGGIGGRLRRTPRQVLSSSEARRTLRTVSPLHDPHVCRLPRSPHTPHAEGTIVCLTC